jgi:hypothetical protein
MPFVDSAPPFDRQNRHLLKTDEVMATTLVLAPVLLLLAIAIMLCLSQGTTRPPSPDYHKSGIARSAGPLHAK